MAGKESAETTNSAFQPQELTTNASTLMAGKESAETTTSAFQPQELKTNASTGGLAKKKKNLTEMEKKALWPPVDKLPPVKPTDKEVIAIAQARKPKDLAGKPLGIWRHTKAPHAFGYRGRLLAEYYHICDRQADGTFILEEKIQKTLVNNYPAFRKARDAGHIYTTKGAREAAPRLFKTRRDEKGKFRKALTSEQGRELSEYGIEKTLLRTYDLNKTSKAWMAGADKNQKSRLSKVRERAIGLQMDAVRERVNMREEGVRIAKALQDAQQKLQEAEDLEEMLKREKEEFEQERAAFRATTGGIKGEVDDDMAL